MKWVLLGLGLLVLFISGFIWFSPKRQPSLHVVSKISPLPSPHMLSIAIPSLQERSYPSSAITKEQTVGSNSRFTSYIVSYTVDGLKEYALMDVPTTKAPAGGYPVVIISHGYIDPHQYNTVSSYKATGDYFASQGYLVLKPDYRGNGNSEVDNDDLKRFAYPIDVMTLLTSLKNIPSANTQKIYLWGHSMGGEVTLEVMEILGKKPELARNVKAAVLWAPVTDPVKWFSKSHRPQLEEAELTPSPYAKTIAILGEPTADSPVWESLSPLTYLSDITIPLQLNHGTADETVPYAWSQELVNLLQQQGKTTLFISYPGANHNLSSASAEAYHNNLLFFESHQ